MKKFDISELVVSGILDAYRYTVEEETEASAVTENALLLIKSRGCSVYTVEGREYIADESHAVFLPAGVSYSLYVRQEGECSVVEFATLDGKCQAPCSLFTDGDEEIVQSVKNLLHYWSLKGPAYHSKCLSELYGLITQISTIQSYAYTMAGKYGLIHASVKYIEKNYRNPDLYTSMLARISNMGETYYRNIFLSVFGVPPTKYIQQYRVEKAKELLVNSTGSVEEIALAVGFANASYFCKVFKAQTGKTPSEFAEKARWVG